MPNFANDEMNAIIDEIRRFFEENMTNQGFITLDDLYPNGIPPLSQYLWDLDIKLNDDDGPVVFSSEQVEELKRMSAELQTTQYSNALKASLPRLLVEIDRVKRGIAKGYARNLASGKRSGLLDPSANRAGLIGNNRPAMKKVLGMEGFATTVGEFLVNKDYAPRIKRESKGLVDPALANLKNISEGKPAKPMRNYGTGTGGRRKSRTRKGRKSYKLTRRNKN
jgi:hypothetical protein